MTCLDWCRERCTLRAGALVISTLVSLWGVASLMVIRQALVTTGSIDFVSVLGALFQIVIGVLGVYGAWKQYSKFLNVLLYVTLAGFLIELVFRCYQILSHELQVQRTINDVCVQATPKERAHCRHLIWSFRGNSLYESWSMQISILLLVYGSFMTILHCLCERLGQGEQSSETFQTEAQQNSHLMKDTMMHHGIMILSGAMFVLGIAGMWVSYKGVEVTMIYLTALMMMRTSCKACIGAMGVYVAWLRSAKLMRIFFWLATSLFSMELLVMAAALTYYEVTIQQYVDQVCGSGSRRAQCEHNIREEHSVKLFGSLLIKAGVIVVFGGVYLSLLHLYRRKLEETDKKMDSECPNETTHLAPGKA